MLTLMGSALAQAPGPQQAQRQLHQCRDPDLGWRVARAAARQPLFQLLAARTLPAGAVAAEGNKAIHPEAVGEDLRQATTYGGGDQAQGRQGQAGQGFLETLAGAPRPSSF